MVDQMPSTSSDVKQESKSNSRRNSHSIKSSVNAQAGVYDMNFTFSTRVRFYLELSCRFDIHI